MNNIKRKVATLVAVMLCVGAQAQQDAGFSMYFFNPLYVNPAYAGTRALLSGVLVHRSQWIGMDGAPTTQSLTLHSAIPGTRVGLGLQIYNDQAGPMHNTGINATYAYHLPVNERTKVSFGITGMVNNISVGWSSINVEHPADPAFTGNAATSWVGDASAGVYLYKTRFYAGVSVNHLMQSKFGMEQEPGADRAKFYRQYNLMAGYVLPLNETIAFMPCVLVKYVNAAPIVREVNGIFVFYDRLYLGAGYRAGKRIQIPGTDHMLIGIAKLDVTPNLHIGYSYDVYLSQTGAYNSGTHEVMLGCDINRKNGKGWDRRYF